MFDYHFTNTIVYDSELGALMEFEEYELIDGVAFLLPMENNERYAQL